MLTIIIIASIVSLLATILAMIYIVPAKKKEKLAPLGQFLHEALNFNHLILEKILHGLYVLSMCCTLSFGFFMLFYVEKTYHYDGNSDGYFTEEWKGYLGFIIMLLGPIAVRISYELIMMLVLAVKNIIEINGKLENKNGSANSATPQTTVDFEAQTKVKSKEEPQYVPLTEAIDNDIVE